MNDWNGLQYYDGTAGTGGLLTALNASRSIGIRIGEHVLRFDLVLRWKRVWKQQLRSGSLPQIFNVWNGLSAIGRISLKLLG